MRLILGTFICLTMLNVAGASDAVLWRQELSCDSNSTCRPGALLVDKTRNEVIILGTSTQVDKKETTCWLWKIDSNGIVKQRKSLGWVSEVNFLLIVRPFGIKATLKPDTGDIISLNTFADDDVNSVSLSIIDRKMQIRTAKLGVRRKRSETFLLHDMISCQSDNLLSVGQESMNGIVMKSDLSGNVIWKKVFDNRQTDILSSIDSDPDGESYYVAGISAAILGKIEFADNATICALRYDSNGELKGRDFFEGGLAPWPSSLPKIIYLPCGIVLVVYDKSNTGVSRELYAKAYTIDLTPLWEKQILQTKEDGPPARFDICATGEDRFVLANKDNIIDLTEYKVDGTILRTLEFDGEAGAGDIYVDYMDGKILLASTSKLKENEKEAKIKLLALKPYKAD